MNMLEKAITLAIEVHAGQYDKAGKPYILHPLRLMQQFSDEETMMVAVLHDVVEDGDITLNDLTHQGFNGNVIDAIDALTRRDVETYDDFIARVKRNPLATKIKIADLKDNLDLTRLDTITHKDLERVEKYHQALKSLQTR